MEEEMICKICDGKRRILVEGEMRFCPLCHSGEKVLVDSEIVILEEIG
jgi:Zn finger protein HypA/HybF involved in hydrogenase expression